MGDARCEDRPRQSKFMWGGDWLMATAASISRARSFRCIFFLTFERGHASDERDAGRSFAV